MYNYYKLMLIMKIYLSDIMKIIHLDRYVQIL